MEGNIVFVNYELSSWKYQKGAEEPSPYLKYICGDLPLPENSGIIIKRGYVEKGMGSCYGGKWQPNPNKPQDGRYVGKPGEIKTTVMKNGDVYKTKIGEDGRAEIERHETDHNRGDKHTNPHDHKIDWSNPDEHPVPGPPINYPGEAPEFKQYRRKIAMENTIYVTEGDLRFESISDFKRSMKRGGEVQFVWNGITYCCFGKLAPAPGAELKMLIGRAGVGEDIENTDKWCDTADELLEYMVGSDRLRDVITQVTVIERTI